MSARPKRAFRPPSRGELRLPHSYVAEISNAKLNGSQSRMLTAILDETLGWNRLFIEQSLGYWAMRAHLHQRHVPRALTALETAGWIKWRRGKKGGVGIRGRITVVKLPAGSPDLGSSTPNSTTPAVGGGRTPNNGSAITPSNGSTSQTSIQAVVQEKERKAENFSNGKTNGNGQGCTIFLNGCKKYEVADTKLTAERASAIEGIYASDGHKTFLIKLDHFFKIATFKNAQAFVSAKMQDKLNNETANTVRREKHFDEQHKLRITEEAKRSVSQSGRPANG